MKRQEIHKEIDHLSEKINTICHRPRATSLTEADEWERDPLAYYQHPVIPTDALSDALANEIERVADLWLDYQNRIIPSLVDFCQAIEEIDAAVRLDSSDWEKAYHKVRSKWQGKVYLYSEGDVRNIDHVELFAWKLPVLQPAQAEKHRQIGSAMAGLLFIEKIGVFMFNDRKYSSKSPYDGIFGLNKINALFQIS